MLALGLPLSLCVRSGALAPSNHAKQIITSMAIQLKHGISRHIVHLGIANSCLYICMHVYFYVYNETCMWVAEPAYAPLRRSSLQFSPRDSHHIGGEYWTLGHWDAC